MTSTPFRRRLSAAWAGATLVFILHVRPAQGFDTGNGAARRPSTARAKEPKPSVRTSGGTRLFEVATPNAAGSVRTWMSSCTGTYAKPELLARHDAPTKAGQVRPVNLLASNEMAAAPQQAPATPKPAIDVNRLTDELQKQSPGQDDISMVWWIPEEYWRVSLQANAELTQAQIDELVSLLSAYTIIVVVEGKIKNGVATYRSEADVRAALALRGTDGRNYTPLAPDRLGEGAKALADSMRPVFADLLGPLGKNMHIAFFPGKNATGRPVASASEPGSFSITLRGQEYRWRLPLASLVPGKTCPSCKEQFSGGYRFCPYDATGLR